MTQPLRGSRGIFHSQTKKLPKCSRLMPSVLASLQLRSCKPQMSAPSAAPFLDVLTPKNPLVVCGHSGFIQRQDFSGTHPPLVPPAPRSLLCAPAFYFHSRAEVSLSYSDEVTEQGTGDAEEPGGSYRLWLPTALKIHIFSYFPHFSGQGKVVGLDYGMAPAMPHGFPRAPTAVCRLPSANNPPGPRLRGSSAHLKGF